jgi:CRISPR-associated protein Cas5a/b/c
MNSSLPLFFLKVSCVPHWGWKLNLVPFSKSRPPLLVPPPATLIGALAYPLNRALKLAETLYDYSGAERLRDILKYVGFRIDAPLINYFDLTKISFFYRKEVRSDSVAIGKTYILSQKMPQYEIPTITVCYIIDEAKAHFKFGERIKEKLVEAALGITRIGSRESLVAPLNLSYGEARLIPQRRGKTVFSFLRRAISHLFDGNFITSEVVDWERFPIGDYSHAEREVMIVPYDTTEHLPKLVDVELSDDYIFIDAGGELVIGRR